MLGERKAVLGHCIEFPLTFLDLVIKMLLFIRMSLKDEEGESPLNKDGVSGGEQRTPLLCLFPLQQ